MCVATLGTLPYGGLLKASSQMPLTLQCNMHKIKAATQTSCIFQALTARLGNCGV